MELASRIKQLQQRYEGGVEELRDPRVKLLYAIDENGRALPVPGLILESPEQEAEWEGGKRRYELRKERHREGF